MREDLKVKRFENLVRLKTEQEQNTIYEIPRKTEL